jgi:hypothetical protein
MLSAGHLVMHTRKEQDMWRHGDVLIRGTARIPRGAQRRHSPVLVRGEMTGHSHRLEVPEAAEIWEHGEQVFLRVLAPAARVIHEEHKPITLPAGIYMVWQQREYTPAAIRLVAD